MAWTDITSLLYQHHVSWGYYVETGTQPDCEDDAATCPPKAQSSKTPGIWNPLPTFTDVQDDHQLGNVQSTSSFFAAAKAGKLPAMSWVTRLLRPRGAAVGGRQRLWPAGARARHLAV